MVLVWVLVWVVGAAEEGGLVVAAESLFAGRDACRGRFDGADYGLG
jgi:hypothetical protein